ncbi:hypothetical protein AA0121_g4161 [Alternaria tenuissima]|nr:hypothetical protein AA0121_g4161 [Alternaria tenuissima]
MSTTPIALILGSGPNVGTALTTSLTALNYRIATASRSGTNALHPTNGTLSLAADFSSPSCIPSLFAAVLREYGAAPSVVIWNASALTPPPVQDNVLSVPQDQFVDDLNVNTVSPFFYADQREPDGTPMVKGVDGPAHGEFYASLAQRESDDVPWLATFVKDKGYVKF